VIEYRCHAAAWCTDTHVAPDAVLRSALRTASRDRIRAVAHRLGLAIRRGDRARVEMVTAMTMGAFTAPLATRS